MHRDQDHELASRIAGQFDTLRDRVVAAEYANSLSNEEVNDLRTEMAVLASQYFELTGETLK